MRPTRIECRLAAGLVLAACWTAGCGGGGGAGAPPEEKYAYHELEEIIVTVRPPGSAIPSSLTLRVQVELLADEQSDAVEALTKRWSLIKDRIIVYLIRQPLASTHDKKVLAALRKDLAKVMNDELDKPYVQRVLLKECYFQ